MKVRFLSFLIFLFVCVGCFINRIDAMSFREGGNIVDQYIVGEYNGERFCVQARFIRDEKGNVVYSLEPFGSFRSGESYKEYIGDDKDLYNKLSIEQKRKIELLGYYGYGYQGHEAYTMYGLTQMMIWQVINPDIDFYLTDSEFGSKVTRYNGSIDYMNYLVRSFDNPTYVPFKSSYIINYGNNLAISSTSNYEVISSSYDYEKTDNGILRFKTLENSDDILVREKSFATRLGRTSVLYEAENSQDFFLPGDVIHYTKSIHVDVTKSRMIVNFERLNNVYSSEAKKENICYSFYKSDNTFVREVCYDDEQMVIDSFAYGDYFYFRTSDSNGFLEDREIRNVTINSEETNVVIPISMWQNNILLEKYMCLEDGLCEVESGAEFGIYDKNGLLITSVATNESGYVNISLGYGMYDIRQLKGNSAFDFINPLRINVVENGQNMEYKTYSSLKKIVEDNSNDVNDVIDKEPQEDSIEVSDDLSIVDISDVKIENPDTSTDFYIYILMFMLFIQFIIVMLLRPMKFN